MAFVVLRLLFAIARDPTSHNLCPFEIRRAGALSIAIMFVLALVRRGIKNIGSSYAMNASSRKFLIVFGIAAAPFAVITALLLAAVGPTDYGLRCVRTRDVHQCQILQTRFFGVFGNSSFTVPESNVSGAKANCASGGVGRRGTANCTVNLLLNSGAYREYPVLSFPTFDQAEAATRTLNRFLATPAVSSIEMKDDISMIVVLVAGVPLLIAAGVLVIRRWRFGQML